MAEETQPAGSSGQTPPATEAKTNAEPSFTEKTTFTVEALPESLRSEAHFKTFAGKPLVDVLKSGLEAHKLVGSSVRVPSTNAKAEDITAFVTKLRPESADKYGIKFDAKTNISADRTKEISQIFFEAGLHPHQASKVSKAYESLYLADMQTVNQTIDNGKAAGLTVIKAKYGQNFEHVNAQTSRAAKRFGGEAFVKLVSDYALDTDPVFFDTFKNISDAIDEDVWVKGETPKFMSKVDAKTQVDAILADAKHPYHSGSHANHAAAVDEVNALRKVAYAKG